MIRDTGVLVEWNTNYSRRRKILKIFDILGSYTLGYLINYVNSDHARLAF